MYLRGMLHPRPIEGPDKVPWEALGQIRPEQIPQPSETYPGPWTEQHRGNGHIDLYDAMGRNFAHVYCWDQAEWDAVDAAIKASQNTGSKDGSDHR